MARIPYFQEGGGAPMPGQGGAPQGGGDPTAQLQQMVQQYAQSKDPQLAVAIADTLVQAMGLGGGAPQGASAPEQGMSQPEGPQGYGNGGKLTAYEKLKAFKSGK